MPKPLLMYYLIDNDYNIKRIKQSRANMYIDNAENYFYWDSREDNGMIESQDEREIYERVMKKSNHNPLLLGNNTLIIYKHHYQIITLAFVKDNRLVWNSCGTQFLHKISDFLRTDDFMKKIINEIL